MYSIFSENLKDISFETLESNLLVYKDILDLKKLFHELEIGFGFKITQNFESDLQVEFSKEDISDKNSAENSKYESPVFFLFYFYYFKKTGLLAKKDQSLSREPKKIKNFGEETWSTVQAFTVFKIKF